MIDLIGLRLRAQRLIGERPASPVDVVRRFGAVQAQDYAAATWALGQRTAATTEAEIDRLFDSGAILRTHVMRPTWHFVLPEDARWLLHLTGPRVRRSMAGRLRELDIDEDQVARATEVICAALTGGRFLTRPELGEVLRAAGISPDGQRLPHLLMAAELAGAIISGPRRGKQFTYALLAERAPGAHALHREGALAELTCRYFQGHGPARIEDFVWWSGLTVRDARAGLALAGLRRHDLDGQEYWLDESADAGVETPSLAHLLPTWDEYTVGYRDRSALLPPDVRLNPELFPFGLLSNVVTVAGRVRGSWRRNMSGGTIQLSLRTATDTRADEAALEEVAGRVGAFLQAPIEVIWSMENRTI